MTADQTFERISIDIDDQIKTLKEKLAKLEADQKKNPNNWGFVGTAQHLHNALDELNSTLTY